MGTWLAAPGLPRYDPPHVRAGVGFVPAPHGHGEIRDMGKGNKTRKKGVKKPKHGKKQGQKPAKK
jgi:hypothetical protein